MTTYSVEHGKRFVLQTHFTEFDEAHVPKGDKTHKPDVLEHETEDMKYLMFHPHITEDLGELNERIYHDIHFKKDGKTIETATLIVHPDPRRG